MNLHLYTSEEVKALARRFRVHFVIPAATLAQPERPIVPNPRPKGSVHGTTSGPAGAEGSARD